MGLREELGKLLIILQTLDPTVMREIYSHDFVLSSRKEIRKKEDILSSKTAIKICFKTKIYK